MNAPYASLNLLATHRTGTLSYYREYLPPDTEQHIFFSMESSPRSPCGQFLNVFTCECFNSLAYKIINDNYQVLVGSYFGHLLFLHLDKLKIWEKVEKWTSILGKGQEGWGMQWWKEEVEGKENGERKEWRIEQEHGEMRQRDQLLCCWAGFAHVCHHSSTLGRR